MNYNYINTVHLALLYIDKILISTCQTLPTSMNSSELREKRPRSSKTLRKKGKLPTIFLNGRFPLHFPSSFRQRKLKEAREAAEIEVAKYRR